MGRNICKLNHGEDYSLYLVNGKEYRVRDFEEVKTKEDAYFIGYLLGDGAFSKRSSKKLEKLTITSVEEYIIQFFNKRFQPDSKYRSIIPINNTRNIVATKEAHIMPLSSIFTDVFYKYNIMGLKQDRRFVELSNESLMKSYIMGLIDADGYVSYHYGFNSSNKNRKESDKTILKHTIGVTHPSTEMLIGLNNYLNKTLGINGIIDKKGNEKCMIYRLNSRMEIRVFIDWLYSDLPQIYNIDKYNKMISLLDILNRPLVKVSGVRRSSAKKESYISTVGHNILIGTFDSYDKAVKQRLITEAKMFGELKYNLNYNSHTQTFQVTYLNPQDNLTTFIEVDLQGNILQFYKKIKNNY